MTFASKTAAAAQVDASASLQARLVSSTRCALSHGTRRSGAGWQCIADRGSTGMNLARNADVSLASTSSVTIP